MKTIIAGSRTIRSYSVVDTAVKLSGFRITEVVSGAARGVDILGEQWAARHGVPCRVFEADWNRWGKRAGYLRNVEMGEYAEALIAVWDGISPGTKHMINIAYGRGLKVYIYQARD